MTYELVPEEGPLRTRTLADAVAAELHQLILSGEVPPGAPLRIVDLAERLDVSPMPVREALRRLEAIGLVEIIAHKGARVRELSEEDLRDTQETRIALESLAVGRAARVFTEADATAAAEALAEHTRLSRLGDQIAARQAHRNFHFILYRASGSRWLPRAIEPVWRNSERYRFARPPDEGAIETTRREHQAILDACVAHDPDAAADALRAHLENAATRILAAMSRARR